MIQLRAFLWWQDCPKHCTTSSTRARIEASIQFAPRFKSLRFSSRPHHLKSLFLAKRLQDGIQLTRDLLHIFNSLMGRIHWSKAALISVAVISVSKSSAHSNTASIFGCTLVMKASILVFQYNQLDSSPRNLSGFAKPRLSTKVTFLSGRSRNAWTRSFWLLASSWNAAPTLAWNAACCCCAWAWACCCCPFKTWSNCCLRAASRCCASVCPAVSCSTCCLRVNSRCCACCMFAWSCWTVSMSCCAVIAPCPWVAAIVASDVPSWPRYVSTCGSYSLSWQVSPTCQPRSGPPRPKAWTRRSKGSTAVQWLLRWSTNGQSLQGSVQLAQPDAPLPCTNVWTLKAAGAPFIRLEPKHIVRWI